jgi:hypothetical protein
LKTLLKYWPAVLAGFHVVQSLGSGNPALIGTAVLAFVSALGLNHIAVTASAKANACHQALFTQHAETRAFRPGVNQFKR